MPCSYRFIRSYGNLSLKILYIYYRRIVSPGRIAASTVLRLWIFSSSVEGVSLKREYLKIQIGLNWEQPPLGEGDTPRKLGKGVRPACQNPNPQNLWFSLPYLWPDQRLILNWWPDPWIKPLFHTCVIISYLVQMLIKAMWRAFVDGLIDNDEKVASSKINQIQDKTRVQKRGQNDQDSEQTIPFGAAHTYKAHIREYPPSSSLFLLACDEFQ